MSVAVSTPLLQCPQCSALTQEMVQKGDDMRTIRKFPGFSQTQPHRVGARHSEPFEHTFFQYNGTGHIRRSKFYEDAARRVFLCFHLDCMDVISPGCMYCDTHKKLCTKCRTEPRASRTSQLCVSCMGKPIKPKGDDCMKNGKKLIHATRYKKGRCERCGPKVTFHNFRDSTNDVWVSRDKQCAVCYATTHPDEAVMDWSTVGENDQFALIVADFNADQRAVPALDDLTAAIL